MRTRLRPRLRSLLAACAVVVSLSLAAPPAAFAQDDDRNTAERVFAIGFDAAIVRPLRAVAVVVGFAIFVPAAIVTAPSGKTAIGHAWDKFVAYPSQIAFQEPLGEL